MFFGDSNLDQSRVSPVKQGESFTDSSETGCGFVSHVSSSQGPHIYDIAEVFRKGCGQFCCQISQNT